MSIKILKTETLTWVNIDQVDEQAVAYLKESYTFHPLDLEDVRGESHTPKIDTYKNYLFMILQFPQWRGETHSVVAHELDIFIGENYIITIQNTKSRDLKNFFYRCMKNRNIKRDWMSSTSGYLLYKLLEALFKNTQPILNSIGKELSQLEQNIFDGDEDEQNVKELALHRRNVLNFRRIIDPQRYLVASLSHIRK